MLDIKNIKILYVEDDINANEEVSYFLKQFTDQLYIAFNGKEGLAMFKEHGPDIVVTDIQMPIMNGIEMIENIKKINKDVFVIVITAFNETQHLLQAINLGISKYLLKPLNLKEFLLSVREISSRLNYQTLYQSLDKDGDILDVNQAWLDYLGFTKEEVIGKNFADFISKESMKQFEGNFSHLKQYGRVDNLRFFLKKKDDTYVDVILNGTSSYDENGKFIKTHCELKNLNILINLQDDVNQLLSNERYLKSLVSTHVLVISAIVNAFSKEKFLQDVCNAFIENVEFKFAFIALLKQENKLKVASQSLHEKIDVVQVMGEVFEINSTGGCPTCRAISEKKMIIVDDIEKLEEFPLKKIFVQEGIESIVSIPIVLKPSNELIGVITLTFKKKHTFQKDELELFSHISETIAFGLQAIANIEEKEELLKVLHTQATTDSLTLCANRHKGKEFLKDELERAKRYGRTLALIYLDIDDFKKINDKYGHDIGDKVLVEVASCIRANKRSSDVGVRWGGEEFLVILPENDCHGAVIMAEKLRGAFREIKLDNEIIVTASFGVVAFDGKDDWDTLIRRADNLMYKAKNSTKDSIVHQ
ncbi:diguanylate cyclase [Candidatus Sulfurimonas marisnigri]|uniref:diguanylate cyclase n=1 Tax=Candidatus Sulfurimonas marisnigri TaxID=2740405 RepID=A0A7S7LZA2_9BACT|nr:diguanylate cyclase [Candidatus Sulfurimonas marisnigri]QOY54218.1 diguanylate cyclase [Candidatus Sulfurimonas marisnigri]